MWVINLKFIGKNGTYTIIEETATSEEHALKKYHRELLRWYDILIMSYNYGIDESASDQLYKILNTYDSIDNNEYDDVMLYIIKDDLKRFNKQNNTDCCFTISMREI